MTYSGFTFLEHFIGEVEKCFTELFFKIEKANGKRASMAGVGGEIVKNLLKSVVMMVTQVCEYTKSH